MILGIDASNVRSGGGVSHLNNLLKHASPDTFGFKKVILWSGKSTLDLLPQKNWLDLREIFISNYTLIGRLCWQTFILSSLLRENCNLLFVPGGLYMGSFRPYVTMSQNLLPFSDNEVARYGFSARTVRMKLLFHGQKHTFANSNGIIFLTQHARKTLISKYPNISQLNHIIIPHGVDPIFAAVKRSGLNVSIPIKLLYVSTVDLYKHQWNVVTAVSELRNEGFDIKLSLVGSCYPKALEKLNASIYRADKNNKYIKYDGFVDNVDLPSIYEESDLFIFASTCENFPIILLEAMASQLPIACSSRSPMPEILGDAGVYFDPENITSITNTLRELLLSKELRKEKAQKAKDISNEYSWDRCANETFKFLSNCI